MEKCLPLGLERVFGMYIIFGKVLLKGNHVVSSIAKKQARLDTLQNSAGCLPV